MRLFATPTSILCENRTAEPRQRQLDRSPESIVADATESRWERLPWVITHGYRQPVERQRKIGAADAKLLAIRAI